MTDAPTKEERTEENTPSVEPAAETQELKKQPKAKWCSYLCKLPLIGKYCNPNPVVAHVRLSGVIGQAGFKSGLSLENVEEPIKKAFAIPKVSAVAISINSPGGSPVQSELIYRFIRMQAEEKEVQVLVFAEDVVASGGYWLACSGDEIYASASSVVGSIGVISSGFGFTEMLKRIGVERRVHTQGKNKSILDPFQPEKKEDITLLKSMQKDIHQAFIDLVKERRGDALKKTDTTLFSGAFWSGQQALKFGLIDQIGSLHEVLREKFGKEVQIIPISQQKGWLKSKLSLQAMVDTVVHRAANAYHHARYLP